MVEAGVDATVEQVFRVRMAAFKKDPHLHFIDQAVCRRFKVRNTALVERRARAAYFSTPVGKLTLFPASRGVLRTLARRGVRNFIVSFGDPETQHAKVRALGLDSEPAVKKIFYADAGGLLTKDAIFQVIQLHEEQDPTKVLVVGDRASSEIRAGKALGFHTARLRHGEFAGLAPAGPEEHADHLLHSIGDVLRLPYRFGK
jgi:FMN phosphatase YigB (HAD superfamily)